MTRGTLDEARALLVLASREEPGLFQRAAVLLARQALESSLRVFWVQHSPDLQRVSTRAQLAGLAVFLAAGPTAGDAAQLWNALSRACHYDDNYLSPSPTEVEDWLTRAERLCRAIENSQVAS